MTNDVTNADHCPTCGAAYALVGRVHRCMSKPEPKPDVHDVTPSKPAKLPKGRYRYRDADQWRAYMRDWMRKRRAKQKS